MDQLVEPDKREQLVTSSATRRACCARRAPSPSSGRPTTSRSAPPPAPTRRSPRRRSGACRRSPSTSTTSSPTSTPTCCSSCTGAARGKKGEAWRQLVDEEFRPRLERMWREQDYLHPRALLGYFPCNAVGNSLELYDPEDPERVLETLVFPRQPGHDRICITDFYRPKESPASATSSRIQAVTAGPQVTELMAELEKQGEFAEQLYTHGLGVQTAEGMAEWLHAKVRVRPRHPARPGPPLVMGLPRVPGPVRAHEGLPAARRRADRPVAVRRPRGRARAVDGRDRRPPPAGGLLRHEVGLHPQEEGLRRRHQGVRAGPQPQRRSDRIVR